MRKRAGAIDMVLSHERGFHIPCDVGHSPVLAWTARRLYSLFVEITLQNKVWSSVAFPVASEAELGRVGFAGGRPYI